MSFQQWKEQLFHRYLTGEYDAGLRQVADGLGQYPDEAPTLLYYEACLLCKAGRLEAAVGSLRKALEQGHWYAPAMFADQDLSVLGGRPDFEAVKEALLARHSEVLAKSEPVLLTHRPENGGGPWPTLVALHGQGGSAADSERHWAPAAEHGWQVALAQSRYPYSPGTYSWTHPEERVADLSYQCTRLPHTDGLVLAGFSRGCAIALRAALSGAVPARGVLAVAPSITPLEPLLELLKSSAHRPRLCLIVGDQDRFSYGPTLEFAAVAQAQGLACDLKMCDGLKHDFPLNFAALLPTALTWLHQ